MRGDAGAARISAAAPRASYHGRARTASLTDEGGRCARCHLMRGAADGPDSAWQPSFWPRACCRGRRAGWAFVRQGGFQGPGGAGEPKLARERGNLSASASVVQNEIARERFQRHEAEAASACKPSARSSRAGYHPCAAAFAGKAFSGLWAPSWGLKPRSWGSQGFPATLTLARQKSAHTPRLRSLTPRCQVTHPERGGLAARRSV